jgi:hypothetical protein
MLSHESASQDAPAVDAAHSTSAALPETFASSCTTLVCAPTAMKPSMWQPRSLLAPHIKSVPGSCAFGHYGSNR